MVETKIFINSSEKWFWAIFLYIAYVYNEIFIHPNGIFTRLGWVDVDFFSTSALCR